jgi:UDP-glucose 4-epimerase
VLVVGGAGFVGSHLVDRLLAEGYAVDVVDDLSTGQLANLAAARAERDREFSFHRLDAASADLAALLARRDPGVVVHLAGAEGVQEVVAACGRRRLVVVGADLPESAGADAVALRLGTVYGPRQDAGGWWSVTAWARAVLAGRRPTVRGDDRVRRDFVFVDDVVDAVVRALDAGSGVLDVGTGSPRPVREVLDALGELTARVVPPPRLLRVAVPDDEERLDPAAAHDQLGWEPWTALDEGLRLTLASL